MSRRERGALEPQLLVLLLVLQHLAAAADPAHGGQGACSGSPGRFRAANKARPGGRWEDRGELLGVPIPTDPRPWL